MEKAFVKILALLNKPIHYFLVGCCLIIWNKTIEKAPTNLLLIGIILLLLSFASFIEFITRNVCTHIRKNKIQKQKQKLEQQNQEQLKNNVNRVIDEYKKLKGKEKEIIDYCINNNIRVFEQSALSFESYSEAITSLIAKGFANSRASNSFRFVIDELAFIVLEQFINKDKGKDKKEVKNEPK